MFDANRFNTFSLSLISLLMCPWLSIHTPLKQAPAVAPSLLIPVCPLTLSIPDLSLKTINVDILNHTLVIIVSILSVSVWTQNVLFMRHRELSMHLSFCSNIGRLECLREVKPRWLATLFLKGQRNRKFTFQVADIHVKHLIFWWFLDPKKLSRLFRSLNAQGQYQLWSPDYSNGDALSLTFNGTAVQRSVQVHHLSWSSHLLLWRQMYNKGERGFCFVLFLNVL